MAGMQGVVAAQGLTPDGDTWTVLYRPEGEGGRHYLAFLLNGRVDFDGSGFDFERSEIGFQTGLKSGVGNYVLVGLVTPRIQAIRAESIQEQHHSEVLTELLPWATAEGGGSLRSFVIMRPPVDNVTALVGLDRDGQVVQRIPFLGPFE